MKKRAANRAWFLWIGGACFLVGSLVAGSVGLASSATTAGPTVNQGAPGSSPWPVSASGNVGLSGPLPAGSNDIGTVHVAAPKSVIGEASCAVADTFAACQSAGPQPVQRAGGDAADRTNAG